MLKERYNMIKIVLCDDISYFGFAHSRGGADIWRTVSGTTTTSFTAAAAAATTTTAVARSHRRRTTTASAATASAASWPTLALPGLRGKKSYSFFNTNVCKMDLFIFCRRAKSVTFKDC